MIRRLAASGLACALLASFALGQSPGPATGTVQGMAFTADAEGGRSVLPDTRISPDGPSHIETRSPRKVSFVLRGIASSYTITAQAPGMTATQNVKVRAGSVSRLELEKKVEAATESATVTAPRRTG